MNLDTIKIIVVDDNKFMTHSIANAIKSIGIENVFEVNDGYEAINIATRELPQLIFLDLIMPGIDGFQTLRLLKSMDQLKNTFVIVTTANDDIQSVTDAIKLGANKYILKSEVVVYIKHKLLNLLRELV